MIRILHTNDLHGRLTEAKATVLARFRANSDLYFDTGDCIKTGNLGIPMGRESVWNLLYGLNCTASVIGNRETHVLESVFSAKIAGAQHPVLCANLNRKDGSKPLSPTLEIISGGVRIGILGVSVPMVTRTMATQGASAFLWDPPISVAQELARSLRPRVDFVIALTHIGMSQDVALAEKCPDIDVILGGHSHTILETPKLVNKTWICQGGSHAHFFGNYAWDGTTLSGALVPWST